MLRKIKLYGHLAKFVGRRNLTADVNSAGEAVRFLLANWPGLEAHMVKNQYRVHTAGEDLELEQINNPAGKEIRIVPVIAGAGAVGRILAGVALVALAIAFAPLGAGFLGAGLNAGGSSFVLGAGASAALGSVGTALVLGGIAELIAPTPKTGKDENDPRKSFSFSGVQNTSRVGVPVPIVYGETLVGSVVISAGADIIQVSA